MYTDPSGYQYVQQEEDTKFKWSFQDEMARTERELGLWNGGITSCNDTWNGYISAKSKGWLGSYSDFQQIADKQTSNPSFDGTIVVHTFLNFKMKDEVGVTSKIATTIKVILGGSNNGENTSLKERNGNKNDYVGVLSNITNTVGISASTYKNILPIIKYPLITKHWGNINLTGGILIGRIGFGANLINTASSAYNLYDKLSIEHSVDALFTGISWFPIYGDFVNGLYLCGKGQVSLRQENILNNRPVEYQNYIPATGDVWNYSW